MYHTGTGKLWMCQPLMTKTRQTASESKGENKTHQKEAVDLRARFLLCHHLGITHSNWEISLMSLFDKQTLEPDESDRRLYVATVSIFYP